jgi:beta-glucuronidase
MFNIFFKFFSKNRVYLWLAFFLVQFQSSLVCAQTMQNVYHREKESLQGKWQIIVNWYDIKRNVIGKDQKPQGKTDFVEFDFTDALTLNVPGDWNSQRPELLYYEGTVCYKKTFDHDKRSDTRTFLHFGAVNYLAEVYLNGERLGVHEGGFTPFQFEVTSQIKQGENVLIVIVSNQRKADHIPAENFGWWNFGGITRDVHIVETPRTFIEDYMIQLAKGSADVIQGWVRVNGALPDQEVIVEIPELKVRQSLKVAANGYAAFLVKASKLSLWSPSNPKLYDVVIKSLEDSVKDRIGFRRIEVKGEDILLNGKPVFLKGINIHEEIPESKRRAYSQGDAEIILNWVKDLGCNFIRLSHYPMNEYIVRLAEEKGLMLWEEVPLWQRILFEEHVIQKAELQLTEMISRDKNRCNVIIWSVSNETRPGPQRDAGVIRLLKKVRSLDSTRLVTAALSHFKYDGNTITVGDVVSEHMDVIGINKYLGWYEPWPDQPGNVKWNFIVNKPVIYSEFGSESVYGNHGPNDVASLWTEEHQEKVFMDNIAMFSRIGPLRGVCPWLLTDFRDPTRLHPVYQEGWNRKGLLSDKGERKKAWYVMKNYYGNIPEKY